MVWIGFRKKKEAIAMCWIGFRAKVKRAGVSHLWVFLARSSKIERSRTLSKAQKSREEVAGHRSRTWCWSHNLVASQEARECRFRWAICMTYRECVVR